MKQAGGVLRFSVVALLAVAVSASAWAQLPAGWVAKDIGDTGAAGSTKVDNGKWTVSGSGQVDNEGDADAFHFAYLAIQGDGGVMARLTAQGGFSPWTGVMIRGEATPGAQHADLSVTTSTVADTYRLEADTASVRNSGAANRAFPLFLRYQRVGNQFAGFTSADGRLWRQITPSRTIAMPATALFGLHVSSRSSGDVTVTQFDTVDAGPHVVSVTGVQAAAIEQAALIVWNPATGAVGYNVYRGADVANLKKLNNDPQAAASYLDLGQVSDQLHKMVYAVSAVFKKPDGSPVEGPLLRVR